MHSNLLALKKFQHGFGLIELMVSITIITMVSGVVIARHNSFNGAVLLRNQAYEIAFALRETQLLAVSGSSPDNTQQYGVYFSNLNKNAYIVFRDNNGDGTYTNTDDVQIGPIGVIDRRFEIRNIFYNNIITVPSNGTVSNLSVSFRRPNFDALFKQASGPYRNNGSAYIDIARKGVSGTGVGDVRRVEITSTGQVIVTTY